MRNWIRKWLGFTPLDDNDRAYSLATKRRDSLPIEMPHRNMFEVINAVNGKIVVYNRHTSNPHGPDKNEVDIYLVHDGDNLMDTITTAIVSAGLK